MSSNSACERFLVAFEFCAQNMSMCVNDLYAPTDHMNQGAVASLLSCRLVLLDLGAGHAPGHERPLM